MNAPGRFPRTVLFDLVDTLMDAGEAELEAEFAGDFRAASTADERLRVVVDRGKEVVEQLFARRYTLGIISNVITSREITDWMDADGFTPYFKSVALSSVLGIRKPDPEIYHIAARQAGVAPERCAYVGDNLKRDVTGTRAAGFGMVIIMISPQELARQEVNAENCPDAIIHEFIELLDLFPVCPDVNVDRIRRPEFIAKH